MARDAEVSPSVSDPTQSIFQNISIQESVPSPARTHEKRRFVKMTQQVYLFEEGDRSMRDLLGKLLFVSVHFVKEAKK